MMPVNALASLLEAFFLFAYRQTRRHCCTPAAHACGVISNSGICPTISTQKLWGAIGGTGLHLPTLDCFLPPISVLCARGAHNISVHYNNNIIDSNIFIAGELQGAIALLIS